MANLAIVGIGRWGRVLVDSVVGQSDTAKFTHGVARTPEKAAEYCEKNGITLLPSLDAALADPAVDGVVLATPHSQHAEQIKAAAKAGKAVFCEKPVDMSADRIEGVLEVVETAGVPLPGGDFPVKGVSAQIAALKADSPFLSEFWAQRLVRAYGTEARDVLGDAGSAEDLGPDFGATLTGREVLWLMQKEFARTAEDVVWRRGTLGLRLKPEEVKSLGAWMDHQRPAARAAAE